MSINIFEGARRIAYLLGGLWAAGFVAWAIFDTPYSSLTVGIRWLGASPAVIEDCGSDDAREYVTRTTPDGTKLDFIVCFIASEATDGRMLVPHTQASDGKVWMNGRFSSEVTKYTKRVADSFVLTPALIEAAKTNKTSAWFSQMKQAAQFIFGGLVVGWAVIAAIGWIVRGFMGIPRGLDSKPSKD